MATTAGTIKHRKQTAIANRASSDISANAWNDSEVVTGPAIKGKAMVTDSAQPDGWGWGVVPEVNGLYFGGSRQISVPLVAAAQDAIDYFDIDLDGSAGYVVTVKVEVRTSNAATSVTPKVRNITDASDSVVGSACTATAADYSGANSKQTLTLVLAAGVKTYRFQLTPQNVTNPVYGIANPIKVV